MAGRDQSWDMLPTGKCAQTYGSDYSISFLLQSYSLWLAKQQICYNSHMLLWFSIIAAIHFWARLCENGKLRLDWLQRARLDRPATSLSYTGTCQCKCPYRLCAYFLNTKKYIYYTSLQTVQAFQCAHSPTWSQNLTRRWWSQFNVVFTSYFTPFSVILWRTECLHSCYSWSLRFKSNRRITTFLS